MDLNQAILYAKKGQSVLFTGAGFSFGASNFYQELDNKIPDARVFATHLAKILDTPNNYDLSIIAEFFCNKKSETALIGELQRSFTTRSVQQYHVTIAEIPWKRVYTTNYDDCFEFAALQTGSKWSSVTVEEKPTGNSNLCVHINGHLNNLTIDSMKSQVKLTHSSYSAESFSNNHWSHQLRQDLYAAKSVIFVGYSLSDIDVARLLFSSPELKSKVFFVVAPNADEIGTAPLNKYGHVLPIGVENFASVTKEVDVPEEDLPHVYTWLKKYDSEVIPSQPDNHQKADLFTLGVIEPEHVAWSIMNTKPSGYVRRREIDEALVELQNGRRWFLFHSDLGNGKTVYKYQMSHVLSSMGYKVFWDSDFGLNRNSDIQNLTNERGKIAVFIDETSYKFEAVEGLLNLNVENIHVFLFVRTTLYELGEDRYEENLPADYIPIDLNRIQDSDISDFIHVLDGIGLWGDRTDMSHLQKEEFIKVNCTGSTSKIILSIFEQSEVGRKLELMAKNVISEACPQTSLVILAFLLSHIGRTPSLTTISEILGIDAWELVRSPEFGKFGELVRLRHNRLKARSSVVSAYLLRKAIDPKLILKNISDIVIRLGARRRDKSLHEVFTELQRFAVLEKIINTPDKYDLLEGYYFSLSETTTCNKSSLFWLQYAMCRLANGQFKEAERYFSSAKALAKGNIKETTDVNNHFARLLLDSRTEGVEYTDYFEAFYLAHRILIDQINKDTNRHFPFRQAVKYVDFISFRKKDLSSVEIQRFSNCCKQVLHAIEHLSAKQASGPDVARCKIAVERAIEIASK